jgi:hypothetical protein
MDKNFGRGHRFQTPEPGGFRAEFAAATAKVRAFKPALRAMSAAAKPPGAPE